MKDMYFDINAEENFNFSKIDEVYDFMLHNDIKPFINFGFKPRRIIKNIGDYEDVEIINSNNVNFKGIEQYNRLVKEFVKHCVRKYGSNEVKNWKFEFWWEQKLDDIKMDPLWMTLFEIFKNGIKTYSPQSQVGGFGFNIYDSNRRLEEYLKNWKQEVHPDFLTVYLYPYNKEKEFFGKGVHVNDPDFVKNELIAIRALLKKYNYPEDKLYITEWNSTVSDRDYLHDSCYMGAYILKNIIDSIDLAQSLTYYGNTDKMSEYFDSNRMLFGASGLISKDGIRKPSYYAFEFLNHIGNFLIEKGDNYLITSNENNNIFIVCHNYVNPNTEYYYNNKLIFYKSVNSLFQDTRLHLNFRINNIVDGNYKICRYVVNTETGSIMDEVIKAGGIENIDDEELEYLRTITVPKRFMEIVRVSNGILELQTDLTTNEIQLISIYHLIE